MADNETAAPGAAPAVPQEQVPGRNLQERVEYLDRQDAVRAQLALPEWHENEEAATNFRLARQHVAKLPTDSQRLEDGTELVNDPATLRELAANLRQSPPAIIKAANEKYNGDELAAINELRRTDRKAYFADDGMRARERDLHRYYGALREHLDTEYAKSADGLKRDLEYLRQGFAADPKNFERNEIAKFIQQGMPPTRAHAVAAYFREKLKGSR